MSFIYTNVFLLCVKTRPRKNKGIILKNVFKN
jgi:hypothetical protein